MLTLADQGMLVTDALNQLPHPEDLAEGKGDTCCPKCCAPCGLLQRLAEANVLDDVVRQAPEYMWGPSLGWWKDGGVNKEWLQSCWSDDACCSDDSEAWRND